MIVKLFKLVNGEELVAKTDEQRSSFKDVRMIHLMDDGQGRSGVALVPWFMANPEAEVEINLDHVVAMIDCPMQLEKAYLEQTSGIQLAR